MNTYASYDITDYLLHMKKIHEYILTSRRFFIFRKETVYIYLHQSGICSLVLILIKLISQSNSLEQQIHGCAGSIVVTSMESKISKQSLRPSQVCYIHFAQMPT